MMKGCMKMEIKDFLELCKDKGNYKNCFINIYDKFTMETKKYKHIEDAIRDFGYFELKEWYLDFGALVIETRTQF